MNHGPENSGRDYAPSSSVEHKDLRGPFVTTGVPVIDIAQQVGPRGATYEEEHQILRAYLKRERDVIGPASPVIFVNSVRELYIHALNIVNDKAMSPYKKCTLLFQIFDGIVLAYKNLSLVYCDAKGTRSVFGYSDFALKTLLSRIEDIANQVAGRVHDAYSLTVLNNIVATAEQRLSQVQTEQDMMAFFSSVSGNFTDYDGKIGSQLPRGIDVYNDPYPEVDTLVERLHATKIDINYIRDFYDSMFLIATGNSPGSLTSALQTRLTDNDRNIVLFDAPGDRLFASSMCASAIGYLRKKLRARGADDGIKTYRVNYGRIFSKYRGDSERNFNEMMEWIKSRVRASDTFHIFWFPDIENLMSPRSSGDQEHIATIKNSMLQHMDVFNKDRTLRSFLLLFNSSEGPLDSAFSRRLETVIQAPANPLTDASVAVEVIGAELYHYHINLTDRLTAKLARLVGAMNHETGRVGGFAQVQATLRDMYMNQKLLLSHDARAVETANLPHETMTTILGRYIVDDSLDKLYDLGERPMTAGTVALIAFSSASELATQFADMSSPIKHNAVMPGDPKEIGERTAASTLFLHDI